MLTLKNFIPIEKIDLNVYLYISLRRILYWMCEEEVNLVICFPCKLMMSKNFDWIKQVQSKTKIVFAIPVNSSFQAVNLRFFPSIYCPCKVVKCGFFVTFATRRKYVVNYIFHHLCFKCNYCANITFA